MTETEIKDILIKISTSWIEHAGDLDNYHTFIIEVERALREVTGTGLYVIRKHEHEMNGGENEN